MSDNSVVMPKKPANFQIQIENVDTSGKHNMLIRSISQKPTVAVIVEEYSSDNDDNVDINVKPNNDINDVKKGNRQKQLEGQINPALDVNNSSLGGSISSLPIITEQYCCCKRWKGLECTLMKGVGIVVILIIIAVITVSILRNHGETKDSLPDAEHKFSWNY